MNSGRPWGGQLDELSPREAELLKAMAEGLTNKGIAQQFGISHQTARNHLSNVYRKLGVRSRAEAVLAGFRRGLLQ